jgi:CysZ protein
MFIQDAIAAAEQIFTPAFRWIFWKILGLTLLVCALAGVTAEKLVILYVHLPWVWLATIVHVLTGVGLAIGLVFLIGPVSFLIAGLFFDELAARVERDLAGPAGCGRAQPLAPALWTGLKFGLLSLAINLLALGLLLVPGVNIVAFFFANAYLFGRGFFELAALRYRTIDEVRLLRRRYGLRLFIAGMLPAALSLVPIVNVLTPLFATALLVRIAQPLVRQPTGQLG